MATYYYTLIRIVDRVPYSEKRAMGDFLTDTLARNWVMANDPDYIPGQTDILTRQISVFEGEDRGFAPLDVLGDPNDSASTPGSAGTLSAKTRLMTSSLDSIATSTSKLINDSINVSNQSTTPLTASNNFTGIFDSLDGYTGVLVTTFANVPGATNGIEIHWSSNGTTIDFIEYYTTVLNNGNYGFAQFIPRKAGYVRPKYINDTTNQTTFRFAFRKVNQAQTESSGSGSSTVAIDQTTPGATNRVDTGLTNLANETGGNLAAAATSLSVIDDWDETDRVKANIISGQVGVEGGSGTVTAKTQRTVLATDVPLPTGTNSIGQVTANAGTNLNTSSLALESGGNLANISGAVVSQGTSLGTTKNALIGASVSASAPTYTAGQISPLSMDANGNLRVTSGGGGGSIAAGTNTIGKVGILSGDLRYPLQATLLRDLTVVDNYSLISCVVDTGITIDPFWSTPSTVNGGTVTQANGLITMATNTSANGTTEIHSMRKGRYAGGTTNRYITNIRLDAATANNTRRWGVFDANHGLFFELAGTTFSIVRRSGAIGTSITSFNGTAPTIDTNFHTWEILYKSGIAEFYQDGILIHKITDTTALAAPTLTRAIRFENNNSGGLLTNLKLEYNEATIMRLGKDNAGRLFVKLANSSTTTVHYGPCKLLGIFVNSKGNGGSTVTAYDNTAASGSTICVLDVSVNQPPNEFNLELDNGLTLVNTATSGDIVIIYSC